MTGTGTQADPYIITSVADLYSMETLGGAAVYFELGADIDFNGTPYAENFSPIPLKCLSFDGKGHSITNIFVSDSSSNSNLFTVPFQDSQTITFKDLTLSNISLTGRNITFFSYSGSGSCTINLYGCTFSTVIDLRNVCCVMKSNLGLNAELCTFSFSGMICSSMPFFISDTLRRCHIHLELLQLSGPDHESSHTEHCFFTGGCSVSDSYITGSFTASASFNPNGASCMSGWECSFSNFYSALAFSGIPYCIWDGTYNYACFYDRELSGIAYSRHYDEEYQVFLPLTTAQCKNAAYLQSIGFVVEGGN